MVNKDLLARLNKIHVILNISVRLRSGQQSNFYCDIKKAYGHPSLLTGIAKEIGKLIDKNITCVAASGYGGLPLAVVVATMFNLNFVAVRDKVKKYGRGSYIDGYVPNEDDKIIIIDDVLTTGSSIKETYSVLRKTKAEITEAIVVVKRGEASLPIPHRYIFTIDDLIKISGQ